MIERKTISDVVNQIRAQHERTAQLSLLTSSEPLRRLVAVWQTADITETGKLPKQIPTFSRLRDQLDWLWSYVTVNFEDLQQLVGEGPDVNQLFARARAGLLIYPDGSVHSDADRFLTANSLAQVARRSRRKAGREQ